MRVGSNAQWSLKCTQPFTNKITHMYTCAHNVCRAFVCTLSRSTFEYNSLFWHCWRELSKQLSRPLLWLRSAHRAAGWREQLKRVSVSALRPVSMVERTSSDHQKARLRNASWPETATEIYLLYCICWMWASFSPADLSDTMFFGVANYSD